MAVLGRVEHRAPETVNPKIATGEIEVSAREIRLLNEAKTPPFPIADEIEVSEETRLQYRYLDLRRPRMQHNMILRHRATMAIRQYFDEQGFLEIETPMLTKSTPEGARDYLVPSRVHPGEFFALPQSPQIFKQILMIAGMDRYFQIVKCFRDEDLRADRQPEFTQVDLEISFATEDLVFATLEPLMGRLMALIGRDAPRPFLRLPYAEAIARYGSDKPDLRCGMEIADLSAAFADVGVLGLPRRDRGRRRGARVRRARRGEVLAPRARRAGRTGEAARRRRARLGAARRTASSRAPALKAAGEEAIRARARAGRRRPGRSAADGRGPARGGVEAARPAAAERREEARTCSTRTRSSSCGSSTFRCSSGSRRSSATSSCTIPFTAPLESDRHLLETDQGRARARAYDLVLNGSEIGGGSIRIHDQALQRLIFKLLGISDEEAKLRFGFFVDALEYGTPPHGGIALGLDRIVAILCGRAVDSRRHRVPENRAGRRPDGGRPVDRQREAAEGAEAEVRRPAGRPSRPGYAAVSAEPMLESL